MGFTESIPMGAIVRSRLKIGLKYVSNGHAAGVQGLIDLRRLPGLQAARKSVIGSIELSQQSGYIHADGLLNRNTVDIK